MAGTRLSGGSINYFIGDLVVTMLCLSGGGINYFIVDLIVTMLGWHKTTIPQVRDIL